jgi:hypothetical protein
MKAITTLRAELEGSNRATALGISARGHTPVLDLCRKLVANGHDPASPLEAWRGDTLALRIRSIGKAAGLTVKDDNVGRPRFRPLCNGARAPLVSLNPESDPPPTGANRGGLKGE